MRTTRDAIKKRWLPCPETAEHVDVERSFADCRADHGCAERLPSACPLYVERLIRRTVGVAAPPAPAGAQSDSVHIIS